MRPIDKKEAPYEQIQNYGDVRPYLLQKIGPYCSYCEMKLDNAPEVEHVCSKSRGGSVVSWNNLLLGCKFCNSRKGAKVTLENVDSYAWPDEMNTAIAYTYENGVPQVNHQVLDILDPSGTAARKADSLYDLVKLGSTESLKDSRLSKRLEAFEIAKENLNSWKNLHKVPEQKNDNEEFQSYREKAIQTTKKNIVQLAKTGGFFSVWMTVFEEEEEIVNALLQAFPGTNMSCYDSGKPRMDLMYRKIKRQ